MLNFEIKFENNVNHILLPFLYSLFSMAFIASLSLDVSIEPDVSPINNSFANFWMKSLLYVWCIGTFKNKEKHSSNIYDFLYAKRPISA